MDLQILLLSYHQLQNKRLTHCSGQQLLNKLLLQKHSFLSNTWCANQHPDRCQLVMMLVGHHDSLSHPGICATQCLITQHYVWFKVHSDIRKSVHACLWCQHSKIHRHTVSPLATFATSDAWFDQLHVDVRSWSIYTTVSRLLLVDLWRPLYKMAWSHSNHRYHHNNNCSSIHSLLVGCLDLEFPIS